MGILVVAEHEFGCNLAQRVEGDHHRLLERQRLQLVEQVVQADPAVFLLGRARTLVVPRGPGSTALRQHAGVGVQHGAVGLVANVPQQAGFVGRGLAQQGQCLVGVGGQHDVVEALGTAVGVHGDALRVAVNGAHRGIQPLVGDGGDDAFDVTTRATGHGPPLGTTVHLDESVVVAEADHRGDRKLQHLRRRATPDAGHHGQEVPVPELGAETVLVQPLPQRAGQLRVGIGTGFGQARGQAVEAQHLPQHAQETPVQQVAPLGEHRVEVGAVPFQQPAAGAVALDREGHVGLGGAHPQFAEQADEVGIGPLVEDQKAGVHAPGLRTLARGQGDVHRVGVPAKIITGLEQCEVGMPLQGMGDTQTRDAGTDDGNLHEHSPG